MPSIEENRVWARPNWWKDHGEEWSSAFGNSHSMWHGIIAPRIAAHLPAPQVLEIACGHGRCTRFLAPPCGRLWAVDLAQENIDVCRSRLSEFSNIDYAQTDGKSLPMIPDGSLDFAFSWDSLVHAETDAIDGYLAELKRTLKPGACAFLHHSNLGACRDASGAITVNVTHWRGQGMSAERFRLGCLGAGLVCVTQELIPWAGPDFIDCFSYVCRPPRPIPHTTVVREHREFYAEAAIARKLSEIYTLPAAMRLA